jgi:hypothetical protein
MGESENRELLEYFADRKIWLLEPDLSPPRLILYVSASSAGTPQDSAPPARRESEATE